MHSKSPLLTNCMAWGRGRTSRQGSEQGDKSITLRAVPLRTPNPATSEQGYALTGESEGRELGSVGLTHLHDRV